MAPKPKHEPKPETSEIKSEPEIKRGPHGISRADRKPKAPKAAEPPVELKKDPAETSEQREARHWLRRWLTNSLVAGARPSNLHVNEAGGAARDHLLGVAKPLAQRDGVNADLLTSTMLELAVATSGGALLLDGSSVKPAAVKPAAKPDQAGERAVTEAKAAAQTKATNRQTELSRRWADTRERVAAKTAKAVEAVRKREAQAAEKKKAMMTAAMRDPENKMRIADPNNHGKLAKVAPSLKRLAPR